MPLNLKRNWSTNTSNCLYNIADEKPEILHLESET